MRLICPNCGAQYAVDDRVIPEAGRDVQCSSCGHSWFQQHPDFEAGLTEELAWDTPEPVQASYPAPQVVETPESEADPDVAAEPEPEAEIEAEAEAESDDAEGPAEAENGDEETAPAASEERDEPEVEPEPVSASRASLLDGDAEPDLSGMDLLPSRPKLEESVLAVLREEAEREQAARREEARLPEFQPELGMTEAGVRRTTADYAAIAAEPEVSEALNGTIEADHEEAGRDSAIWSAARRNRLPDVEQVTSTLDPSESGASAGGADAEWDGLVRRRGLRVGLGLAFLLFGLALLIYSRSDRIAAAVPEAADPLEGYVASVDAGRFWLDDTLRGLVGASRVPPVSVE